MSDLAHLRSALQQAGSVPLHGLQLDTNQLDQEIVKLRRLIDGRGTDKPAEDAVAIALGNFYRDRELRNQVQARLVSFGCLALVRPERRMVIEDEERFPLLLNEVDRWLPNPRAFRRCYRGLLYAYFDYDAKQGPQVGRDNWEQLRAYLRDRAALTRTDGALPAWVESLQDNMHLLGDDPGSAYGRDLLAGNSAEFDRTREALDIREGSWLIWQLVLGQIDAAVADNDKEFQAHLPKLLELLGAHPLAVNEGLVRLLGRYRACTSPTVHAELRDFAVAQWGNPWLAMNNVKWSRVDDAPRQMVAAWLKLDLIQRFFNLLAEDGSNDTRRLKFWEQYHDSIDDMYFALGSKARLNRTPDFRNIREKMAGRLLNLHDAGPPDNNAFIMCIGDRVVVEFGLPGNACFIFRRDKLPFKLDGDIAGNTTALKHDSKIHRLLHKDGTFETWEKKFETALASRLHVQPGQASAGTVPSVQIVAAVGTRPALPPTDRNAAVGQVPPAPLSQTAAQSPAGNDSCSLRELSRLCDPRRLRIDDRRAINGNLWVRTDDQDGYVSKQLRQWGFSYKPIKGWWRK